jgi:6-phosphogluconolactonase
MSQLRQILPAAVILLAPLGLLAGAGRKAGSARAYRVYVGDYTSKTSGKGIYEFQFDADSGKMSAPSLAAEIQDPSWIVIHPNRRYLYAAGEHGKDSSISAFSIGEGGRLQLLNQRPALGADPCHLAFDRSGKFLLTANYSSGNVAVFPILPDGGLGEHTALVENRGRTGPHRERQEGPHAHWIGASEDNRLVYVADLGLDQVLAYGFDAAKGTLTPSGDWAAKPGTGPRHVAFSNDGKFMYVAGELESTVSVFPLAQTTTGPIESVSMLPPGFSGRNDAAEIAVHPGGRFLYASNRGHDSIAVYAIDAKQGTLTEIADVPSGGKEPRHFAIDPSGRFLLAENQFSNSIVEFRIDQATGKLTPTGEKLEVPSPVCIAFLELE